jgi:hypothetical protein
MLPQIDKNIIYNATGNILVNYQCGGKCAQIGEIGVIQLPERRLVAPIDALYHRAVYPHPPQYLQGIKRLLNFRTLLFLPRFLYETIFRSHRRGFTLPPD